MIGGRLQYAGDGVQDALRTFRDVDARAGNDLSCQAQLTLDESLTPALDVAPCYTGPEANPEELRALRSALGLVNDGVRSQTFLDQQRLFDPGYGVDRNYWKSHFVRELPDELIDELLGRMTALDRPPGALLIESLRGARRTWIQPARRSATGMRPSTSASWRAGSTPPSTSNRSPGPARPPLR